VVEEAPSDLDDEDIARLKALGYVGN